MLNKPGEGSDVTLGNNCIAFMFDEIRYEFDGLKIDHNRNVGITSILKNYVTISSDRTVFMRNAGLDTQTNATGYFNFCVPLYMLLGFCEDYKRVMINARHELFLIQSRNDNNCLVGNLALKPVITFSRYNGEYRYSAGGAAIRCLRSTDRPEKRHVRGYESIRRLQIEQRKTLSELGIWSILYDTYQRFCKNYYGYEYLEPSLTFTQFLRNGPFVIIDCSRQNKSVKSATVDIRLKFKCKENVPMNITAYCLIIHDRVIQYNPLTNVVRKSLKGDDIKPIMHQDQSQFSSRRADIKMLCLYQRS
ncbi:hypothetical protein ACFW04_014102 [Cataglyphis niger]